MPVFKITPQPFFWATAKLSVPGEEEQIAIRVKFKHYRRDELVSAKEMFEGKSMTESLMEIMLDWEGTDAAFSRESIDEMLANYPLAGVEIADAFRREVWESKAKN